MGDGGRGMGGRGPVKKDDVDGTLAPGSRWTGWLLRGAVASM